MERREGRRKEEGGGGEKERREGGKAGRKEGPTARSNCIINSIDIAKPAIMYEICF